ncbi:MAG: inositol-3-phosphate synthase [Pseudomonadota bacterium]
MLKPLHESLGIATVGVGGGVATTAAAGIELIRLGETGLDGLPLAETLGRDGLVPYAGLRFAGWDLDGADLASAARTHRVVPDERLERVAEALGATEPWPAVADAEYCRNVTGEHIQRENSRRAMVARVQSDLARFEAEMGAGRVVVINLASTERVPDMDAPALQSLAAFERGLDENDPAISPAMVYAYAAIERGFPYGNFTPNVAAEIPALIELAKERGVPTAGRDGKTGQTFLKTVLAPAFRARALRVEGWYSTNILGNRDGQALSDSGSLASKLGTKGDVLDDMLGYKVGDHIVQISYYPPRGDEKEAWDNIDVTGFLGQRMQVKVNFLCRDSILAAPLVIEIARCLDLARRRGEAGPIEALSTFFKAPMTAGGAPEHAFFTQQRTLMRWLMAENLDHVLSDEPAAPAKPDVVSAAPLAPVK